MHDRRAAIDAAAALADNGELARELATRVAIRSESQNPASAPELRRYLDEGIAPALLRMGFALQIWENPVPGAPAMLFAVRAEPDAGKTVLVYGHGDVVLGQAPQWSQGRSPWVLDDAGVRWYGRGTADNKGQHTICLMALETVLRARGRLGFNVKLLLEMGEEVGSPGLRAICELQAAQLCADVFIASDGPRLASDRPTLFLGSRGVMNFVLDVPLRDAGHHSGNWGGLLANPATILANAIASLVDARGRILVDALRPRGIAPGVRRALAGIEPGEPAGPAIDPDWGEPGLTPAQRVFGWNSLEVLAFTSGQPERPQNAIPPRASATLQLRFVVGCDPLAVIPAVRAHLDARGLGAVQVRPDSMGVMHATRLDPDHPWVRWAARSIEATTGAPPVILPNLGGSLPNDCFAEVLGLPTLWVPHSYPACSQHAPDEHLLAAVAREGLTIMAGIYWDLAQECP